MLDLWFETEVKPRLRGKATLIRYADDFLIGFEREDDARRVMAVLDKRLGRFGLTLHPDKTRLLPFWRPPQAQQNGKGPATFDFVGFTFYWRRTLKGHWRMWCKPRRASLKKAKKAIYDWCRRHRHEVTCVDERGNHDAHAARRFARRTTGASLHAGTSRLERSAQALVEYGSTSTRFVPTPFG